MREKADVLAAFGRLHTDEVRYIAVASRAEECGRCYVGNRVPSHEGLARPPWPAASSFWLSPPLTLP